MPRAQAQTTNSGEKGNEIMSEVRTEKKQEDGKNIQFSICSGWRCMAEKIYWKNVEEMNFVL